MKKISAALAAIFIFALSVFRAGAEELTFDYSQVYQSLSPEVCEKLKDLGLNGADANSLSQLSFESVISQLMQTAGDNLSVPLRGLVTVIAVLLLCSMLSAYQNSLSHEISDTVQAAASLCVCCAVVTPAAGFITMTESVVTVSANLFLAYIPVMAVMMATSGRAVSSASYYASMIAVGQGAARIFSGVIFPFLNIFLGLSVTAGIAPHARLSGFCAMTARVTRRLLAFVMTVFVAVLSIRQLLSDNLDSVAVRAVKFGLTSFVPVVGSALGEAYKTVQGSVQVLKSGLGVFVIIAIALTFLPLLIQGIGWSLCLMFGKALAEAMGLDGCAGLLESLREVFATIVAVLLCLMAVFIVSTAAAFVMGGGSS